MRGRHGLIQETGRNALIVNPCAGGASIFCRRSLEMIETGPASDAWPSLDKRGNVRVAPQEITTRSVP